MFSHTFFFHLTAFLTSLRHSINLYFIFFLCFYSLWLPFSPILVISFFYIFSLPLFLFRVTAFLSYLRHSIHLYCLFSFVFIRCDYFSLLSSSFHSFIFSLFLCFYSLWLPCSCILVTLFFHIFSSLLAFIHSSLSLLIHPYIHRSIRSFLLYFPCSYMLFVHAHACIFP